MSAGSGAEHPPNDMMLDFCVINPQNKTAGLRMTNVHSRVTCVADSGMASNPPSSWQTAVKLRLVAAQTGGEPVLPAGHLSGMKAFTKATVSDPS